MEETVDKRWHETLKTYLPIAFLLHIPLLTAIGSNVDPFGLIEDGQGNPYLILKEAARITSSLFDSYKSHLVETGR